LAISAGLQDIDPDLALLEGFTTLLPSGLLGFGLVLFCAAIMSSADSYLFACVSIIVHDFAVRLKPIEKGNLVKLFRYAVAVLLLICFLVSFWFKSMVETTFIVLTLAGIMAICVVTSWGLTKIRRRTIGSGMVIGFAGTVAFMVIKPIDISLVLYALALTIGGFICEYLLTLIFKREKTV
jgi:Na+/proline symporter